MATRKSSVVDFNDPTTRQQYKIRVLLAVWSGEASEMKKSDLMARIVKSGTKATDYQPILDELEQEGAIAVETRKRVKYFKITDTGKEALANTLSDGSFQFGGQQVGVWVAQALLLWIRQGGSNPTTK